MKWVGIILLTIICLSSYSQSDQIKIDSLFSLYQRGEHGNAVDYGEMLINSDLIQADSNKATVLNILAGAKFMLEDYQGCINFSKQETDLRKKNKRYPGLSGRQLLYGNLHVIYRFMV